MQVAAEVAQLDQVRQRPRARRLELAAALAQLGRDPLVAEVRVHLLLGLEGVHLARLDLRDPVLGDREPAPDGRLAQGDVVVLGAGEVLEQVAVAVRRHDSQVEAEAVLADDGRLRIASCGHLDDPGHGAEAPPEAQAASVAVAIRSRSRTVSRKRRAEPAIETFIDAGCCASSSATARSRGRAVPRSARGGPCAFWSLLSAARIFSSDFAPRPSRSLSRCASAASRRPSTVVMPSSFQMRRAVFGPRPGRRMKEATSAGTTALRFVSACISPSSIASTIFSSIVLPIPWSSFARPSSASCATELAGLADAAWPHGGKRRSGTRPRPRARSDRRAARTAPRGLCCEEVVRSGTTAPRRSYVPPLEPN